MRSRLRPWVPYGLGAPMLARLWAQRPAQALALRRFRERFPDHPFYADGARDPALLQRHLNAYTFAKWREVALDRCSERSFARWTRFEGAQHVDAALAEGRGLILAGSHHAVGQTLKVLLTRFGLDVVTLGSGRDRGHWRHGRVLWIGDMKDESNLLRSMVGLRKVLKRGGVVHVPADSRRVGRSGTAVEFLGRKRRFAHGFAVLAVTMRVPVIPVFALLEGDGRITVEFHPRLTVLQHGSRAERLDDLVRQYAARLERSCLEHPELGNPRYTAGWTGSRSRALRRTPRS